MNDELQKALAELINKAVDVTGTAQDFMVAEIPDVVQQLLMWKMAYSAMTLAIAIIVMITLATVAIKLFKHYRTINEGTSEKGAEYLTIFFILPIVMAVSCIDFDWLQIWLAPKVYLLEYVSNMVPK